MLKIYSIAVLLGVSLVFLACTKKIEPDGKDYTYHPIEEGLYYIYEVEDIVYYPTDTVSSYYYLKEVIADVVDVFKEKRNRVERFTKNNFSDPWPGQPDSVWTVYNTMAQIIKVENNIRFVKLVFPLQNGKSWNANVHNTLGEDNYTMLNVGQPYTVGNVQYAKAVRVVQNDSQSLVDKDFRLEVFAKDIGLVYKEKQIYEYDETRIGDYIIKSGVKYVQKLVENGKL